MVVVDETIGRPPGFLFMGRNASSVPPSTGVIISDLIVFADCCIGQLLVTRGTFVVGIVVSDTFLISLIGKKLNFAVCASLVPVTPVVIGEVVFIVVAQVACCCCCCCCLGGGLDCCCCCRWWWWW